MGVWMEVKICGVAKHGFVCVCVEWRDCKGVGVVEGWRGGPDAARSLAGVSMNISNHCLMNGWVDGVS